MDWISEHLSDTSERLMPPIKENAGKYVFFRVFAEKI